MALALEGGIFAGDSCVQFCVGAGPAACVMPKVWLPRLRFADRLAPEFAMIVYSTVALVPGGTTDTETQVTLLVGNNPQLGSLAATVAVPSPPLAVNDVPETDVRV